MYVVVVVSCRQHVLYLGIELLLKHERMLKDCHFEKVNHIGFLSYFDYINYFKKQ